MVHSICCEHRDSTIQQLKALAALQDEGFLGPEGRHHRPLKLLCMFVFSSKLMGKVAIGKLSGNKYTKCVTPTRLGIQDHL